MIKTRVAAAILAHKEEHQCARMSVSAICRAAGISRANLYVNHPDLVREILDWGLNDSPACNEKVARSDRLESAVRGKKDLQERFNALLTICVELQAEVRMLRTQIEREAKRRRLPRNRQDV